MIDKLNEKHGFAQERVVTPEDVERVSQGVDSSEEGSVQPTTTLTDEFGHGGRYIRLSGSRFDILEDPVAISLGDELEAQNTVLGQVHVSCENSSVGTVHLFTSKVLLQWPLSSLVVLERYVAICGEGTRKHRDETKRRLERLIQDVAHLVLKILCRNQRVQELFAMHKHSLDLTTGTCTHGLEIKRLPQLVD